ncbi:MAG TPA: hypothetical protein PLY52_11320 [Methanothrix sp.]|nr:hypothetical protein [Methanothrix sp.]
MIYKVLRPFKRWDEKAKAPREYPRGSSITLKEAAKIPTSTLRNLLSAGNIYRVEEDELPRVKPMEVAHDH